MKVWSAVYAELVYGGHLLALGTSSIAATAALVLGKSPPLDLLLMAYLFSYGAYTVNRISDFEQDRVSHPERTSHLEGRRGALVAIAVASFLVGYGLAFLRNLVFFTGLLVPLALAVAYSVGSSRTKKMFGMSRLKEGLLIKNITISFGWALIPLLVGLYYLELPTAILALAPFIFLRLMVNSVFFDQRDVEADRAVGVRTLPSVMGLDKSWRVMDLLDVTSGVYLAALLVVGVLPVFVGVLLLFVPYSVLYRVYARRSSRHQDSVRDFAADGEYILWGVVTYLGHL
ncbi:MAG: UbiA family prenyltransferase [Thaumarchaeota archaeon]|nr:UbiA family prenyltransferase [Nitrososphaerota archaeon]